LRASLEVADIFRAAGPTYRAAYSGHLSLHQLKVMSAVEHCRTAALGGHVEACEGCRHWRIAYNSCRNRHCPRCQGAAARTWLAAREADLLPVGYFHVVFTLPKPRSFDPICVRVNDAARMIGIGRTKLYELIAAGEVEAVKLGKSTRITTASLHDLIRRQRGAA
jgi:excisionase family DNA binding protein